MSEGRIHIKDVSFIKGVVSEEAILYDGIPQVAFIGRSNVGKSTLMNVLMERKGMVKTGRTPGKTKEINFFLIQWKDEGEVREVYFVDLPGYGYARVSKGMREKLQERISWYLTHPVSDLSLVVLIIDARRGLGEEDREILETLRERGKEVFLVINKIDKLNQRELHQLKETLKKNALIASVPHYFISAVKKKHTHLLQRDIFTKMSNVS